MFFSFLFLFLLTAPIVVLYTAGYRFSLTRAELVKTGMISVASVPKGATVLIDGADAGDTTPSLIDTVIPGEHVIRIEKDGYYPWQKTLSVEESKTSFIQKAVIYLQTAPILMKEGKATQVFADDDAARVAYTVEDESYAELWLYDVGLKTDALLMRAPQEGLESLRASWSADGGSLLVQEKRSEADRFTVVFADERDNISLADLKPGLASAWLDPQSEDRAYVITTKGTYEIMLSTRTVSALLDEPLVAVRSGTDILALRNAGTGMALNRIGSDGVEATLAFVPSGTYTFLRASNGLQLLYDRTSRRLILIDASGADQPILLNVEATSFSWNPLNGYQLMYANEYELHLYDAGAHTDELVTRLSEPMTGVAWHPEASALLYVENGKLLSIELDRRDSRNVFTLAEMDDVRGFWLDEAGETAGIIGTELGVTGRYELLLRK